MTPEQKLQHHLLLQVATLWGANPNATPAESAFAQSVGSGLAPEDVAQRYCELATLSPDTLSDVLVQFRGGQFDTHLPCDPSRYYQGKSVAAQLSDGSLVGWCFWYGGGQHGQPADLDWLSAAYDLDVTEEKVLTVVPKFTKRPSHPGAESDGDAPTHCPACGALLIPHDERPNL